MQWLPIVIPVLAGMFGAGIPWLIARRTTSGTVNTSEAETLWAQSQQMREELRLEVVTLRSDVAVLQREAAGLRRQLSKIREEAHQLREENRLLRQPTP